jgi:acyl carrier protein
MRDLLLALDAAGRELRGVFHLAADIRPAMLAELDEAAIVAMLRPKVGGARVLDELTRERPLDAFVLFSSTTALLGVAGLGHYAAANEYLDGLAQRRRAAGLPALSVDWGTWEVMRRASAEDQRQFAAGGLLPLPLEPAFAAMARLCASGTARAFVASVDWPVLRAVYESRRRRPLLEELGAPASAGKAPARGESTVPDLAARFAATPPARRRELVLDQVKDAVARILGHDARAIDPEQGLFEMGMDSLMSVELKGRLEKAVDRALPSTLTFNYPSAAKLADYLTTEVLEPALPSAPPAPIEASAEASAAASGADEDEDLSEDELANLLAERLRKATGR